MKALGLIETMGFARAIEVADIALKSANVVLLGYEKTKGEGMIVVKLAGDVGAVKASVEAAVSRFSDAVYSSKVISRPSSDVDVMIKNMYDEKEIPKNEAPKEEEVKEEKEETKAKPASKKTSSKKASSKSAAKPTPNTEEHKTEVAEHHAENQ